MSPQTNELHIDSVLASKNYLILDTETTGVRSPFQIVQIAIIEAKDGAVLMHELVRAEKPIPAIASSIHGITTEMTERAPGWAALRMSVLDLIRDRAVVTYNAQYDRWALHESDRMVGLASHDYQAQTDWRCAMLWYADVWGEWDDYHGNNRWQTLTNAVKQQGLTIPNGMHSALVDARMTKALIDAVLTKRESDASKQSA